MLCRPKFSRAEDRTAPGKEGKRKREHSSGERAEETCLNQLRQVD